MAAVPPGRGGEERVGRRRVKQSLAPQRDIKISAIVGATRATNFNLALRRPALRVRYSDPVRAESAAVNSGGNESA